MHGYWRGRPNYSREYFVYVSKWDDSKVEGKIRDWKKSKSDKGYTCSQDPIAPLCLKQTCYKRKYGVLTNVQISWPTLSGLTRIESPWTAREAACWIVLKGESKLPELELSPLLEQM